MIYTGYSKLSWKCPKNNFQLYILLWAFPRTFRTCFEYRTLAISPYLEKGRPLECPAPFNEIWESSRNVGKCAWLIWSLTGRPVQLSWINPSSECGKKWRRRNIQYGVLIGLISSLKIMPHPSTYPHLTFFPHYKSLQALHSYFLYISKFYNRLSIPTVLIPLICMARVQSDLVSAILTCTFYIPFLLCIPMGAKICESLSQSVISSINRHDNLYSPTIFLLPLTPSSRGIRGFSSSTSETSTPSARLISVN